MTKRLVVCLTTLAFLCVGSAASAGSPDEAAIIEVVDRAYVHGIHIDRDTEKVRSGFHESFVMFVKSDEGVNHVTRDAWIERMEASKAKGEQGPRPKNTAKISVLDQADDAAVVKVDLFRDGKHTFTDYISVYRFADEWKLVGKIYHRY
jgi:hypothetical protein